MRLRPSDWSERLLRLRDAVRSGDVDGNTNEMAGQVRELLSATASLDMPEDIEMKELSDKRKKLIELWNAGESVEKIAEATGYTIGTVSSVASKLRKQGHKLTTRHATKRAESIDA